MHKLRNGLFVLGVILLSISIYYSFQSTAEKNLEIISDLESKRFQNLSALEDVNESISRLDSLQDQKEKIDADSLSNLHAEQSLLRQNLAGIEATKSSILEQLSVNSDAYFQTFHGSLDDNTRTLFSGTEALLYINWKREAIENRKKKRNVTSTLGIVSFLLGGLVIVYNRKKKKQESNERKE